jgi:hypothetical protein
VERNKKDGKRLLNYEMCKNGLRHRENHPKYPLDKYQWKTK